ncbi:MAG: hypothetical protein JNM45_01755 [Rhizobiales bacterium]|nr:hypothetical protein [Hyphomicrobiales bacterium]
MHTPANLFLYSSKKQSGLLCYSRHADAEGLPQKYSPWLALGVLRTDQKPPYGLSREDIESGVRSNGYQLLRKKSASTSQRKES